MKKITKLILLSCMTIGMAAGCDFSKSTTPSNEQSSSHSAPLSTSSSSVSEQSSSSTSGSAPSSSSSSIISSSSSITTSSSSSIVSSSSASSSLSSLAPVVDGINLNTDNVKKEYIDGDALDLAGLVVTAHYSDNTNVNVSDYNVNPANGTILDEVGPKTITVSYEDFTSEFTVTISARLTSITLNTDAVKKSYKVGEKLDLTGLVVTANYSDNTSVVVTDYSLNIDDGSELTEYGNKEIVVTYNDLTARFSVMVKAPSSIALDTTYLKMIYEQREALDLSGLVVNLVYTDGSKEKITDYSVSPANGTILNDAGETTVTITYGTFTKTFKVTVKETWTEEYANLMASHLYGYVLPYTGSKLSVVCYSDEYNTLYIEGGDASNDALAAYAAKMEAKGFTKISTNTYTYTKVVDTEDGERNLKVFFGKNEDGVFYLEAYDPYYYSFPVSYATSLATQFGSTQIVPSFEADYYELETNPQAIYCYTTSQTAETDYTKALNDAGWDITGGVDQNTGYLTAIAPDKAYMVYYKYETQYKDLDIVFMPINFWNEDVIKAFYLNYANYNDFDVPSLDVAGANYLFQEAPTNEWAFEEGHYEFIYANMYVIGAKTSDLTIYSGVLKTAGWDVVEGDSNYVAKLTIAEIGIIRIEFSYKSDANAVAITFYGLIEPIPDANWPSEWIASKLGEDVTDTIPQYLGPNNGFSILDDYFGTAIVVNVTKGTENDCIAAYCNTLERSHYVLHGYDVLNCPIYYSPKGQISLNIYMGTSGSFTIEFSKL